MKKSYSIFFYEGYIGAMPTIINLAKALNRDGYLVRIYASKTRFYINPEHIGENTSIIYFRKIRNIPSIVKLCEFLKRFNIPVKEAFPIIEALFFIIRSVFHFVKHADLRHDRSIGIDTNGSIAALFSSFLLRRHFAYLSLELNHPDRFSGLSKILPFFEGLAIKRSAFVIIQDRERFDTLCTYHHFRHRPVFYLPNSPDSTVIPNYHDDQENYFRTLFHLEKEQFPFLILQAGGIADYAFAQELASAFATLDNGCALIFHERQARRSDDPYIQTLRAINSTNLFLSLQPVPYEQLDQIYASATIGLAFYKNINDNLSQIAMASGTLPYYLKYGKPVIVSNLASLVRLVNKHQIGIVIPDPSDPEEIRMAIDEILQNYSVYSHNAQICFEKEFDFSTHVKPILTALETNCYEH